MRLSIVVMKRPTHDQLRAEGRNAERKRVQYLVDLFLAGKISPARLKGEGK